MNGPPHEHIHTHTHIPGIFRRKQKRSVKTKLITIIIEIMIMEQITKYCIDDCGKKEVHKRTKSVNEKIGKKNMKT